MTADIQTFKRVDFDGEGTLEGLLRLVGQIPTEVPLDAEITTAYTYEGCPPEAHEAEEAGLEPEDHEHGPRVGFILQWEVEA